MRTQSRTPLANMANNPAHKHPEYLRNRKLVLAASDICWICGQHGADSVDHVIPQSKGGTHDLWNLRPAHMRCNASKGDRPAVVKKYSQRW